MGCHDDGATHGCRRERYGPDGLFPHELSRETDREQPADRLTAEPCRQCARCDESVQYARQPHVPVDVRVEQQQTEVD